MASTCLHSRDAIACFPAVCKGPPLTLRPARRSRLLWLWAALLLCSLGLLCCQPHAGLLLESPLSCPGQLLDHQPGCVILQLTRHLCQPVLHLLQHTPGCQSVSQQDLESYRVQL